MLHKKFVSLFCGVALASSLNFNICYGEEKFDRTEPQWFQNSKNRSVLVDLWQQAIRTDSADKVLKPIREALTNSKNFEEFHQKVQLLSKDSNLVVKRIFNRPQQEANAAEEENYKHNTSKWQDEWDAKEEEYKKKRNEWNQKQLEKAQKEMEDLRRIKEELAPEIDSIYGKILAEYEKNKTDNSPNLHFANTKMDFLHSLLKLQIFNPKTVEETLAELKELLKKSENNTKNPSNYGNHSNYSNPSSLDTPTYSFDDDYGDRPYKDSTPQESKQKAEQSSQDLQDNKKDERSILREIRKLPPEALASIPDLTTVVEKKYNAMTGDKTGDIAEIYNIIQKANDGFAQKVENAASGFVVQTMQKSFVNEVVMVNAGRSSGDESKEFGIWAQGFGGFAEQKKNNRSQAFAARNAGLAIGCDFGSEYWKIGLSYAGSKSKIKFSDYSDQDNIVNNSLGSVYGSYMIGSVIQLSGNWGAGVSDIELTSKKKFSRILGFLNGDAKFFVNLNNYFDIISRFGAEIFVSMNKDQKDKSSSENYSSLAAGNISLGIRNKFVEFGEIKYNAEVYLGCEYMQNAKEPRMFDNDYQGIYKDVTNKDYDKPPVAWILDGRLNAVYNNFLITVGGYYSAHKDFQSASGFVKLVAKF